MRSAAPRVAAIAAAPAAAAALPARDEVERRLLPVMLAAASLQIHDIAISQQA